MDRSLPDISLTGLTADSRRVRPGYLFAAIPGHAVDGARFIPDAIARGASAILASPGTLTDGLDTSVPVIFDSNPRRRLALMASSFYSSQPDTVVGITGTNGKSSVAGFTRQLWRLLGHRSASIGTLGVEGLTQPGQEGLTTPDAIELHRVLAEIAADKIQHVAIECSSHGLDQHRLDGVQMAAAAFTNLSHEHLDYHGTMDAYRQAKLRLFRELLAPGAGIVVNSATAEFEILEKIARQRGLQIISYGLDRGMIHCIEARPQRGGYAATLEVAGMRMDIDFPLPGRFQLENAMAALGLLMASGTDPAQAAPLLSRLEGVRGRLQLAGTRRNGARVYIDYAHKAEALKTVLQTMRPFATGRLVTLFGCGGDRDREKRPIMGRYAARLSDAVIVTDDNPRTESPETIRAEIRVGCPDALEIADRGEAIAHAVQSLDPDDVLLIAGKGHETGQKIGDRILPFDDFAVARSALEAADGGEPGGES